MPDAMHHDPDRGLILGAYDRNTMRDEYDQRWVERLADEAAERHGGWPAAMKWARVVREYPVTNDRRAGGHESV